MQANSTFLTPTRTTKKNSTYFSVDVLSSKVLVQSVNIQWNNTPNFPTGVYGAVCMERNGSVTFGIIWTAAPGSTTDMSFANPSSTTMTVKAGYYTGDASSDVYKHEITFNGIMQKGMVIEVSQISEGAFLLRGSVTYSFISSDGDNNTSTVSGDGNASDKRPWYHKKV